MKRLSFILTLLSVAFISCERIDSSVAPCPIKVVSGKTITISAALEQHSGTTKTILGEGNSVLWSEGDSFSLITSSNIVPLSYENLSDMEVSSSIKVMMASPVLSYGYFLGSEGTSDKKSETGFTDEASVVDRASSLLDDDSFQLVLTKYSSTEYMITNKDGNNFFRRSGATYAWNTDDERYKYFALSTATSVPSGLPDGCSTNYCLQFSQARNSDPSTVYYINSSSSSNVAISTTKNAASSVWHLYEVAGSSGSSSQKFTVSSINGSSADFSGNLPSDNADYYAVYPHSSTNAFNGEELVFQLPQTQTYASGTFASGANPSVGRLVNTDGEYSIDFKNVCGVLRLSLKGSGVVNAIKVKDASGASLWGSASVSADKIGTDQGYATVTGGSDEITLDCGGVRLSTDVATQFNIVVPVGAFSNGFTMTIETSIGNATKTASVSNTIKRSVIKAMPTIPTGGLEYVVPEFSVENPTAADYMSNSYSTFSASYMSTSTFTNNRSAAYDLGYRNDQPNMKTITFSSPSATQATVQMSTDSGFGTMVLNSVVSLSDGTGSYVFGNMVPGTTYYYRVLSGDVQTGGDVPSDVEILTADCFKAVGQLRMIRVDDGWNVRDEGGWTGWNGNKIRYESIYRGGSLGGTYNGTTDTIGEVSQKELQRIGIKAQLDLRPTYGVPSSYMNWVGSSTGAYSLGYSPIPGADYQQIVTDWGLVSAQNSATDVGDLAYIIKSVMSGKPVYFHCRTGADRTGTVGYLLLALLGCDAYEGGNGGNQLAMDYELTSLSMDEDGTIAYNNGTRYTSFSDRQASQAASSTYGYKFFYQLRTLSANGTYSGSGSSSGTETIQLTTFQERAYYYLNRYFYDNSVSTAGAVYIGKSKIDAFINYMLGITELDGSLAPGHTASDLFVGPSWALEHSGYTLDNAISIAVENMYNH